MPFLHLRKLKSNSNCLNVLQIILFYGFSPSQDPVKHHVLHLVGMSSAKPILFLFYVSWEMLTWNATFYFHSLITLANLPPPSGLENTVAEGMRSRENIYTTEENLYELEDPYADYCYVISG